MTLLAVLIGCAAVPWLFADLAGSPSTGRGGDVSVRSTQPEAYPTPRFIGPISVLPVERERHRLQAFGAPQEMRVPRLGVRSPVVPISGQSGVLVPPDDAQVLGWWQEGRRPGSAVGTTVVTGHTVHSGGGAFDRLADLTPGDRLRVRTGAGWIGYAVRSSEVLSTAQLAAASERIFRLQGPPRLVMITCDDWNGSVYLSNAVVTAVPVTDEPFAPLRTAAPERPQRPLPRVG